MKICGICKGHGCDKCSYEGVDVEVTFTRKNVSRGKQLTYSEYQKKKERDYKLDKKNIREEL